MGTIGFWPRYLPAFNVPNQGTRVLGGAVRNVQESVVTVKREEPPAGVEPATY